MIQRGKRQTRGHREGFPKETKKPLRDPQVCEAQNPHMPPSTVPMALRGPGPQGNRSPSLQIPPRGQAIGSTLRRNFLESRLFNHMNSHSLSYLFPASGFPP